MRCPQKLVAQLVWFPSQVAALLLARGTLGVVTPSPVVKAGMELQQQQRQNENYRAAAAAATPTHQTDLGRNLGNLRRGGGQPPSLPNIITPHSSFPSYILNKEGSCSKLGEGKAPRAEGKKGPESSR